MTPDMYAPGSGYTYYYSPGTVVRVKAYSLPEILAPDLTWHVDEDDEIDLAHDYSPMGEDTVLGTVQRIYGELPPDDLLEQPAEDSLHSA